MTTIDYLHPKLGEDNVVATPEHNDRVCEIRTLVLFKFAMGKSLATDAGAIPDRPATHLRYMI